MSEKLRKIAVDAFAEHLGREEKAINVVAAAIRKDRDLLDDAVLAAARDAVGYARHRARVTIAQPVPEGRKPVPVDRREQRIVQVAAGMYYNWPMMDGSRLADATREHLLEDAARYLRMRQGVTKNMRFLVLVARDLKPGETVRSRYKTNEALAELHDRAERGLGISDEAMESIILDAAGRAGPGRAS